VKVYICRINAAYGPARESGIGIDRYTSADCICNDEFCGISGITTVIRNSVANGIGGKQLGINHHKSFTHIVGAVSIAAAWSP